MQRIYRHQSSIDHYHADAFAVRCFDDRFRACFFAFMTKQCPGMFDFESVAGGAKVFASPEQTTDRDFMLRELEKSVALHNTHRVMLFTHYDCGAYGGLARFQGDEQEQFTFHRQELRTAADVVHKQFPGVTVETYFIDTEGVVAVCT
jgi:hypothetical protein